jgi:alpha-L-rhamnosidase
MSRVPAPRAVKVSARIDGPVRIEQYLVARTPGAGRPPVTLVGVATPRLSWRVIDAPPGWHQIAREIEASYADGRTETAEVDDAEQLLVDWPFAPLASRDRVSVRVRVRGEAGWTDWSSAASVEATLLEASDWSAAWITPSAGATADQPAPVLGTRFVVDSAPVSARLHITALGVLVADLNGARVSEDHFSPGWTSYDRLLRFRTYDVTELVVMGANDLSVLLGNGWYRGRIASLPIHRGEVYGDRLGLLAQLELELADGRRMVIRTDETWRTAPSRILANDFYDGQTTDLRLPARPDLRWPTEHFTARVGRLDFAAAPPVRELESVVPRELRPIPGGVIADFGRNLVGWVRLRVAAPAGTEVVVRHAEVLDNGELAVRPLRSAKATDRYILAGGSSGTEILEPTFTYHGFRYAEVTGIPDDSVIELEAVVLGSDLTRTGWFSCSDEDLNTLHQNVVNSMVGNFLDIPTDCPQRDERLGWTGDAQVFAPTASTLFDVSAFLDGWLDSLALDQLPDGTVPAVVPRVFLKEEPFAGWGDAAVIVPWVLYQRYGDIGILRRQYPSMRAWVERIRSLSTGDLWQGGSQLGDWLDPLAPPDNPAAAQADPDVVASSHYFHSTQLLSQCAQIIGNNEDARSYAQLAARIRAAFVAAYVNREGRIRSDCQTVYALAITWNIIDDPDTIRRAGDRLAQLVESQGFTVATGFLGTPVVLHALTIVGRTRDAFRMLMSRDFPGWLYAVDLGATSIWERWDSLLADGTVNPGEMTSFNHYAFGAVSNWMHRTIGGLTSLAPACKRVVVAPVPGAGITSGCIRYDSPYGRIEVDWNCTEDQFSLRLTLPVGVTADVLLPDGTTRTDVEHGAYEYMVEGHKRDLEI